MEYLHIFRAPLLYLNFLGPSFSPNTPLFREEVVPQASPGTPGSIISTQSLPIIPVSVPPTIPLNLDPETRSELIPIDLLFGYNKYDRVRMSPDGKYISYLAPWKGVQNVWVAKIDDIIQERGDLSNQDFSLEIPGRPVSHETERPVSDTMWLFKNNTLVYFRDKDGDENYQLIQVDIQSGFERVLVEEPDVQARILWASHLRPNNIIIGMNKRDPRFHDPYLVDLNTGQIQLMFVNKGFGRCYFDNQLMPRLGRQAASDAFDEYYSLEQGADPNNTESWKMYRRVSGMDAESTKPLNFDDTGKILYWLDSSGRDTAALTQVTFDEPQTTTRVLFADPKADVTDVVFHRSNYKPVAAAAYYDIYSLTPLDKEFEEDLLRLKGAAEGQMKIIDKTKDFNRLLIAYTPDRLPVHYHIYDRPSKTLIPLLSTAPPLEEYSMSRMYARQIATRDGHTQLCYLTIPKEVDLNGQPAAPVPMVLLVHGGPWSRDYFGFSPSAQMLSDRGYAVMQCNFRASKGFGKNWLNLGDGQWAGDMHNDLLDAVNWAVNNKVAIKEKVAIMGASYGGYATLVGLTFTPEVFACGVDLVGPSSLETLLNSIPAYWAPSRVGMVNRIGGDPLNPIGQTLLRSRSPLHRVDKIQRPLLIGHGAHDPRVKQNESQQIVNAMKSRNLPVSYLLFPDEGHGLAKEENMVAFMSVTEHFLEQCLGGKSETLLIPKNSSMQVIEEGNMPELLPYKMLNLYRNRGPGL